jgi:hypothetical protein
MGAGITGAMNVDTAATLISTALLIYAAWLTSIVFSATNGQRPLLIAAAAFFPVGVVHGLGIWFGGGERASIASPLSPPAASCVTMAPPRSPSSPIMDSRRQQADSDLMARFTPPHSTNRNSPEAQQNDKPCRTVSKLIQKSLQRSIYRRAIFRHRDRHHRFIMRVAAELH